MLLLFGDFSRAELSKTAGNILSTFFDFVGILEGRDSVAHNHLLIVGALGIEFLLQFGSRELL